MGTTMERQTHTVIATYSDVVTSIAGAASTPGLLRNLTGYTMDVVKGGASAPDNALQGVKLLPFGAEYCDSDHIWVRCANGGSVTFEAVS